MLQEYCRDQKLEAAGLKRKCKHHPIIDTICQASCCLFWGGSCPRGSAAEVRDAQGEQCLHHRGLVEVARWKIVLSFIQRHWHLSRSTRDTRRELERFMREVKRNNPGAAVKLDYDTVEVGARSYVFSLEEGRVVEREGGQALGSQVSWEYCVRDENI